MLLSATIFSMRVVCQQPHYLPWLGYFELLHRADAFVFLDSVQWIRQGRQHRTRILVEGKSHWLTVPVRGHGHRERSLKEMEIDSSQGWAKRHWGLVRKAYSGAPRFHDQLEPLLAPFFEKAAGKKFLTDLCEEALWLFWEPLGLKAELHWSSEMANEGVKTERLVGLCRTLGASEYYSSLGSTRYLDLSRFRAAGIPVRWQHFRALFPGEPLRASDLSVLDWLAHHDWSELQRAIAPPPAWPSAIDLALPR